MHGQRENSIPTTNKVCGGIIMGPFFPNMDKVANLYVRNMGMSLPVP